MAGAGSTGYGNFQNALSLFARCYTFLDFSIPAS